MNRRNLPLFAIAAFAIVSAATIAATPAQAQGCAQVEVHNVRPGQGMLMIAAYADGAAFVNKAPMVAVQMRAGAETMSFPLCGLSGTSVALTLFQDLNGNGKLDANVLGIPSEPWGASGRPAAMSAPTWESTAVPLDGSPIVVNLSK